nr:MAG TPA: hypothetical protein [Crassvirales sp.]
MFFTQEDYRKIEKWLLANGKKDTQFQEAATPLKGTETVAIVQNGVNANVSISSLVDQIFLLGVSDFLNVTDKFGEKNITLQQAIQLIPFRSRKVGQVITYLDEHGYWRIFQFQGKYLNQWNNTDSWIDILSAVRGDIVVPDYEDITGTRKGDTLTLSFANKEYNQEAFSGLGRVYLRKFITTVIDPATGQRKTTNLLRQQDVTQTNTIYIVQYDHDLNGENLIIPEGSVLEFEGGSISYGTLTGNGTYIQGTKQAIFGTNLTLAGTFFGNLSPLNYGMNPLDYNTTYSYLYLTHSMANKVGMKVDYSGIHRINIDIPSTFTSIPLGNDTDFSGCEFHITNNTGKVYLFERGTQRPRIDLTFDVSLLKGLDYTSVPQLLRGKFILVVQDAKIWSKRQLSVGDTDIYRYDVISIQDGYARNYPIQPYDTPDSQPVYYAVNVDEDKNPTICNGKFYREGSTKLTNLFDIEKVDNMTVKDIYIYTDKYVAPDDIAADSTFYITRVTNFTMERVYQMNTYSKAASASTHGYFLMLLYGFNTKLINVNAYDNDWGVIGSRYLNTVFVDKCNINRFDIHVYGRDVIIRDSIFSDRFCQFGCVYGDVVFDGCTFNECSSPFLYEQTYNYFVPVNIYFKNCTLNKTSNFVRIINPHMNIAPVRQEQAKKYLPNIFVDGVNINLGADETFRIFYNTGSWTPTTYYDGVAGLEHLVLRNMNIQYDSKDTREYAYANLQYNTITLLTTPHILLDNCSLGKIKSESQLGLINVTSAVDTLRVHATTLPTGKKGKFFIKNCLMALPTREYAPYDFTVEDSVIFNRYNSTLAANAQNNYRFVNTDIHFNRGGITADTQDMGDYISCNFIFYRDAPTLYFNNPVTNQGETNVINCITNRQNYGTVLSGRPFVPYSEDNKMIIENEFMHLHISRNVRGGTTFFLLNQEVADSLGAMPSEAYNYAKLLQEVSSPTLMQRVKFSGEADAPWENKPVGVVAAGTTEDRPLSASRAGMTYYDWTIRRLLVWSGEVWRYANTGYNAKFPEIGPAENMPTELTIAEKGFWYFNTDTNEYLYWDGFVWLNSDSTVNNYVVIV